MRDPITYSLRVDGAYSSDAYYAAIETLADEWLARAQTQVGDLVDGFRAYAEKTPGRVRSREECAFELLVLGVLLHEHADQAADLPAWSAAVLTELVEAQDHLPWAEDAIKALRGVVGGLSGSFVDSVGKYAGTPDEERTKRIAARQILGDLIEWLRSQGETMQAARLTEWLDYCRSLPAGQAQPIVMRSLALADEFAALSAPVLSPFTDQVESFVVETAPHCFWRYDAALVTRSRLEYHLGMLGTEILNRAYREKFVAAPRKLVIVPPCLRALPDDQCQALETPVGAQCRACTPTCRVHQITQLAAKQGLMVVSVPDDQLSKLCIASGEAGSGLGVIGLACALRNWTAGWEADRLGLPAQGMLLDQVGCRKHWDPAGRPTDANLHELQTIAGAKA
jgi:uncharacterized protein